ncbi:unnamed protein product [Thelazia callipaeda]|uniref:MamL-1 domain-containing protein n=1 Tax=Thelazia callipaeda TaxID=103827 RepID=A0A0N5CW11_THECL|nr:unnamed protein product [Thelazia callipaeda]
MHLLCTRIVTISDAVICETDNKRGLHVADAENDNSSQCGNHSTRRQKKSVKQMLGVYRRQFKIFMDNHLEENGRQIQRSNAKDIRLATT